MITIGTIIKYNIIISIKRLDTLSSCNIFKILLWYTVSNCLFYNYCYRSFLIVLFSLRCIDAM